MKVSGFTIARNIIKYDYPVVEAITSVLPLCDEFIVAVGKSEDNTLEVIRSIGSDKIRVIETVWDETLREGGLVLSQETNKAFDEISDESDWAFYIQGDEVLHEAYLPVVSEAMERWKDDKSVEGLLFNYRHFWGSYKYVGASRKWYRKEIRIIRNDKQIRSYKDAQGFRKGGKKLFVKPIDAWIYHYGWVKPPEAQQRKQESFHKLWHNDQWLNQNIDKKAEYDYSEIDALELFEGSHPKVMENRIKAQDWEFEFDTSANKLKRKHKLSKIVEDTTGLRLGEYKNYKII